jgi:hypothetical protein
MGWAARLLPVLFAGAHLALGSAATAPTATPAITISAPRESLPVPVHDEATCAFCQAAAFAPHTSRPVVHLVIDCGDEQRVHLSQDDRPTSTASAGPARSRAPPVIRSV